MTHDQLIHTLILVAQYVLGIILVVSAVVTCRQSVLQRVSFPDKDSWKEKTKIFHVDDLSAIAQRLSASNAAATAAFELRAKELHLWYYEAMKKLDEKASSILRVVGGGVGLIALVAGSDKLGKPHITFLLVLGVIQLLAVVFCSLMVQIPRAVGNVNVQKLCEEAIWQSDAGEAQIAAVMGWEYLLATVAEERVQLQKASWLVSAQTFFGFGVATLVVNALFSGIP
jgi:hypothetical protein